MAPRQVSLDELRAARKTGEAVLSVEGLRLLDASEELATEVLDSMRTYGFDPVVIATGDADEERHVKTTRFIEKSIDELALDEPVGVPIYGGQDHLLVEAGHPIAPERRDSLRQIGITHVLVEKPLDPDTEARLGRYFLKVSEAKRQTRILRASLKRPPTLAIPAARVIAPEDITPDRINEIAAKGGFDDQPAGEPLAAQIVPGDPARVRALGKVRQMVELHESVLRTSEQIFAQVRASKKIDGELIGELASRVITGIINDPQMVLNLSGMSNSPYYIVSHSINATLLAMAIATEMGYAATQVHELAYGALLHDIGMMRVRPDLLFKKTQYLPAERLHVEQHPVFGLDVLLSVSGLPKTAALVVYQENERLDGSGYPRARGTALIHYFAKITAVAAAYEAMTADRPHRKALLPYKAMEVLLQQVSQRKFDAAAARALLRILSLFPIGSWVKLSEGSIGRVVGANRDAFTRPVVSVVLDPDGTQVKATPLNLGDESNADLSIAMPVPPPENLKGDMRTIGFTADVGA